MKKFSSTSVSNEAGFTLLEILIAIVILAFITFGIVSITEDAMNTKDRTTEINTNNLQVETAMSRFEWDLSQVYSPLYFSTLANIPNQMPNMENELQNPGEVPPPVNAPAPLSPELQQYYEQLIQRFERNEHFMGVSKEGYPVPRFYAPDKSTFEFFTSSNRRKLENQKQSHFAWVRYALGEQTATEKEDEVPNMPKNLKSLVRYFTADDPYSDKRIDPADIERIKGAVLLRNVENLEFSFWDLQKRKWETNLKTIPQGENLVRGVKILVTWYDSTGNKRTTSRIFRTHWPLVSPNDQPATPAPQGGAQGGIQGGQGGINAGQPNGT